MRAFNRPDLEERFIFRPEKILADKEYYRLVTSAFIHSGWAHLLLNMYTLYNFGGVIVWAFGTWSFLLIYFGSVIGGSLLSLYLHRYHDYAAYGASGGVCGIIFAYVLKYPFSRLTLFPIPVAVPAWMYALAFVIASFYALKAQKDNIGHDAHLGGAMVGLLVAAVLQPTLLLRHWMVFSALLLASGLVLAYLVGNPLFLPLAGFLPTPSWTRREKRVSNRAGRRTVPPPPELRKEIESAIRSAEQTDWLIQEIEHQVGPLRRDESRAHDWVDKFGRNYDVVAARLDSYDFESFTKSVMERLENPAVNFVIVDTRQLKDAQMGRLRVFFADLPDPQFHRLLRSYAFKR